MQKGVCLCFPWIPKKRITNKLISGTYYYIKVNGQTRGGILSIKKCGKSMSNRGPANLDSTHIDLTLLKKCSQLSIFSSGFKMEATD